MSLNSAMWAGLSGLKATATSLSVTGDNIANVNTVGFRGSRAQFEDMLTRSIVGVGQVGPGTRISTIQKMFQQGSVVGTSSATDMAISGRGFFVVRGNHNGRDGQFFTRAGNFSVDQEGYLVNPQGLRLQGYSAGEDGRVGTTLGDLRGAPPSLSPRATDRVRVEVNFSAYTAGEHPDIQGLPVLTAPFDPANPVEGEFFSTGMTVYDSLGKAHPVTVYFTRTGERTFEFHAVVDSDRLSNPAGTGPVVFTSGQLDFDADGQVTQFTQTPNAVEFRGADQQTVEFDFDGSTLTGTPSAVNLQQSNGYTAGNFADLRIDPEGTITAVYSNGHARVAGRVALADFRAQEELERVGGTLFLETRDSGEAFIGFANAGGRGQLVAQALEQSNTDISTEFVRLITDQRAYQATTRVITTSDEMMIETLNIKR